MSAKDLLDRFLGQCPLIAIIRGVTADEAEAIGEAIYEGGIRIVEVPLNSPDPLASIERLSARLGDHMLVGGGTVLDPADVGRVRDAGGRLVVSPNTKPEVIAATAAAGMVSCPGYFTPSEAFLALGAGAAGWAAGATAGAGCASAAGAAAGGCTTAPPPLTMRTLPSASVISSSETLDSETRSIRVLSLRRSMPSPICVVLRRRRIYSKMSLLPAFASIFI